MENRSFDHFLGHLAVSLRIAIALTSVELFKATDKRINGCDTSCSNPENPLDPSSPRVPLSYDAVDGGPFDPLHDFDSITQQVYGFNKKMDDKTSPVTMNGFVANALTV